MKGIIFENLFLTLLGVMNIVSAGGDMTIVLKTLHYRKAVFLDHPFRGGFIAFYK